MRWPRRWQRARAAVYGPPAGLAIIRRICSLLPQTTGADASDGEEESLHRRRCGTADSPVGTEVAANALLKALEEPPADSVIIGHGRGPQRPASTIMSVLCSFVWRESPTVT